MRAIDADAMLVRLEEWNTSDSTDKALYNFTLNRILEQPTIELQCKKGRWIDDLISRQAAIDVLEERLQANGYSNVALVSELNRSIGYLMRLSSAGVQPVRNGKWIPKFNGQFKGGAYWFDCSVCGRIVPDVRNGGWNYCPNCGATMDGD